jgi:hypothetical protein
MPDTRSQPNNLTHSNRYAYVRYVVRNGVLSAGRCFLADLRLLPRRAEGWRQDNQGTSRNDCYYKCITILL